MPNKKRKNPAAVAMAKRRWKNVTKEERLRLMQAATAARWPNRQKGEEEAKTQAVA